MADPSRVDHSAALENIRKFMSARMLNTPVGTIQRETTTDREAKGPSWVSRVTFPAPPEDDVRQIILDAVRALGVGDEEYQIPALEDVRAQWTGFRAGVAEKEPEPSMSEAEKFGCLSKEILSPTTILYAHGGANYLLGPASRRPAATKLAELTRGRCLTLQHRLAPQKPFPAAPLDFLIAYLSLLYPPAGSYHSPVAAQSIVFAADSSGTELALCVVQVILATRRQQGTDNPTVVFHGRRVELPMPAGLAFQSPSMDHEHTLLPSWAANVDHDIVPNEPPGYQAGFPPDEVWPTKPPRGNIYCETSILYHPLVSSLAVKSWKNCPPMYLAMGSKERIVDGAKVVAQLAARQGVAIIWDEYEAMPHNWPMVFPENSHSTKCYRCWSDACSRFVEGTPVQTKGNFTHFGSQHTTNLDVENLTPLTTENVESLMRSKQKTIKPFTGNLLVKSVL